MTKEETAKKIDQANEIFASIRESLEKIRESKEEPEED